LEKDRNRRYESASAFAADVQRYLEDEPVQACPPSKLYRLRKFARRHKTALAVAAGVFLALAGIAGTIGWAVRDRLSREDSLDQTVQRTLEGTGPLLEQEKWREALSLVERAEKLLAAAKRKDRPPQLLDLQKNLSMAERLEEIYGEPRRVKASVPTASGRGTDQTDQAQPEPSEEEFFEGRRQDERFAKAFQEFGIDLETLPTAEAAARIMDTSIHRALVQALDEWVAMRKRARGDGDPLWKKLVEVARQADPDEWRNRFRDALLRRDRPALEKLAEAVPLRDVPPSTAYLLGLALKDLGNLDKPWPYCAKRIGTIRTIFGSTIRWAGSAAMSASRRVVRMLCVISWRLWCCGHGVGSRIRIWP
jgi:hypothetical protein